MKKRWKWKKNHLGMTKIKVGQDMDTNTVNIRHVWWCLYVLSNTLATLEAQFMRNLSSIEVELKKRVPYKQTCAFIFWPFLYTNSKHFAYLHPTKPPKTFFHLG